MFKRSKERDPDFAFLDRFGDPNSPSLGIIPPTIYPDVSIDAATQIRVVQVLPGAFEDEISCSLSTTTLTSTTIQNLDIQFSALSYAWGGFTNPAFITLNGVPGFPVSQNLYCFLQRLRAMGQSPGRWLWIDQICINQHDKQEKSLQVPLMEVIYTRAAEVIIWLGDHAPGSTLTQSRSHQLEKITEYASVGRKDMGLCWWRRLWVLQEYSLATKEPVVQIGSEQILWTELCQFIAKYLEGPRSMLTAATSFSVLNDMIERFRKVRQTPQTDRTLMELAWIFPQLICFDPRDKIYGLLSLLAPNIKAMITPDYERAEAKNVFAHATYTEISHTKSLALLSLTRHKAMNVGLPSWTVDFVYPQSFERMDIGIRIRYWLELFQQPPRSWTRTAPQTEAVVEYNPENSSLTIAGLDFDSIVLALPIVNAKTRDVPEVTSWRKLTLATTSLTSRLILGKEEREFRRQVLAPLTTKTAYKRLVSGEEAYPRSPPAYSQYEIRRILAEAIITDWVYHDAHAGNKCIEDELEQEDAFAGLMDGYFDHLAGEFETPGQSASFFVTQKGFVGLGPRCMRNGDGIILPFGSRYPMLLRFDDTDGIWGFLGFVRVTGIGNNQLSTVVPDLHLRQQRYILR